MSDLISRSAVLEMFEKYKFGAINSDVEREYIKETIPLLVNSIPTVEAIPKEKLQEIVERLEEKKKNICGSYNWETPVLERPSCKVAFNNGICEAIEIVKEVGGKND